MNEYENVLCSNPYYSTNIGYITNDASFYGNLHVSDNIEIKDTYMTEINGLRAELTNLIKDCQHHVNFLHEKVESLDKENKELRKINSNISTALYTLLGELQKKEFYEKIGKC